jgi:serine acetyltransferase
LLWSDYLAHYSYKRESSGRCRALFTPRLLTNSSLHANLLIRLALGGPRGSRWLWRALLLATHCCCVTADCEIGPGLQMTHPIGLSIGPAVILGRDAALFHGITLAGDAEARRPLVIGDRVEIFTGSVVEGALTLGDGCIVGANAVLTRNLRPGEVYTVRSDRRDRT